MTSQPGSADREGARRTHVWIALTLSAALFASILMTAIPLTLSALRAPKDVESSPAWSGQAVAEQAAANRAAAQRQARDEVVRGAIGRVSFRRSRATGLFDFIGGSRGVDLLPQLPGRSRHQAQRKARAFLHQHPDAVGAPSRQLRQIDLRASQHGTTVAFDQRFGEIPVFGSRILANLDPHGALTSVSGFVLPDLSLDTTPTLTEAAARRSALAIVAATPGDLETNVIRTPLESATVRTTEVELMIYRTGLIRDVPGQTVLAWRVVVQNESGASEQLFVDASTGKLLNRYSLTEAALDRQLSSGTTSLSWREGESTEGLSTDQQRELRFTGDTYWLFRNAFGRDSYDGKGATMRIVDLPSLCQNAYWDGTAAHFCAGVTGDDTVAHEWTHAYVEHTAGLVYQWQPGALNEAYSDIFGELVDLTNDSQNEVGEGSGERRPDGLCSAYAGEHRVEVRVTSPDGIVTRCDSAPAAFGPRIRSAEAHDVGVARAFDSDPSDGDLKQPDGRANACTTVTGDVRGRIALVDRGTCSFVTKVYNAQRAGAVAVLVVDHTEQPPFTMGGYDERITIGAAMIRRGEGETIKLTLTSGQPVRATMADPDKASNTDSYRWLTGENDPGLGGAIRDLWMPECFGHPGKVSDLEYHCDESDSGGVHVNSGVPNHTFALLADGGDYNLTPVRGIGLDKAAAIYWRALSAYHTPTTDFAEHAADLVTACRDLVGSSVPRLSTTPHASQQFAGEVTSGDCQSVRLATAATELQKPALQCFPSSAQSSTAPDLSCGDEFVTETVWAEDFEGGLVGWSASRTAGTAGHAWRAVTGPGAHAGGTAFGPAPPTMCSDDSDATGVNSITSPEITISDGLAPRLSFDHYLNTETGYDGGQVRISINGAPFKLVPTEAFVFNGPRRLNAADNTNPYAGQDAFTGQVGSATEAQWPTSVIDLSALPISPGDNIRLRFDISRDQCAGAVGWMVDDLKLTECHPIAPAATVTDASPSPSAHASPSAPGPDPAAASTPDPTPVGSPTQVPPMPGEAASQPPAPGPSSPPPATSSHEPAPASAPATPTPPPSEPAVSAAATQVRIAAPVRLRYRRDFGVVVHVVASDGSAPVGSVTVRVGRLVHRLSLREGRAQLVVRRDLRPGRYRISAAFAADSHWRGSQGTRFVTITRR